MCWLSTQLSSMLGNTIYPSEDSSQSRYAPQSTRARMTREECDFEVHISNILVKTQKHLLEHSLRPTAKINHPCLRTSRDDIAVSDQYSPSSHLQYVHDVTRLISASQFDGRWCPTPQKMYLGVLMLISMLLELFVFVVGWYRFSFQSASLTSCAVYVGLLFILNQASHVYRTAYEGAEPSSLSRGSSLIASRI